MKPGLSWRRVPEPQASPETEPWEREQAPESERELWEQAPESSEREQASPELEWQVSARRTGRVPERQRQARRGPSWRAPLREPEPWVLRPSERWQRAWRVRERPG